MTDEQIEYSIQTGEMKLSNRAKLSHYGIIFSFFIVPLMILFLNVKYYLQGTPKPLNEGEFWCIIIPLLLAFLFYRLQRKRLKFNLVETNMTRDKLDKIIEDVARKLKWEPYINNSKVVVMKTFPSFSSGSWGEQITILFDKNRLLINSICDPDKRSSVVSMGRNKKNRNTLIDEIKKASH